MSEPEPQVVLSILGRGGIAREVRRAFEADAPGVLAGMLPLLRVGEELRVHYEMARVLAGRGGQL